MNPELKGNSVIKSNDFGTLRFKLPGKKKLLVLIVILLIVVSAGTALYVIRNKNSALSEEVCSTDVVAAYNKIVGGETDFRADDLRDMVHEVESLSGFEKDATCVHIAYSYYAYSQDADKLREYLDILKSLYANGAQTNAGLLGVRTIEEMEGYVESIERNNSTGEKADGSG